jgi:integrase
MDDAEGWKAKAWIVDYVDANGERHIQTFDRKKDADEFQATVKFDVRQGVHTPQSKSITIAEAAEHWIKYVELEGRERSTIEHYRNHVDNHIKPRIGREKLSRLTTPRIQAFRDDLLTTLSRAQARKVLDLSSRSCAMRAAGAIWLRMLRSASRSSPTREARQS